MSIGKQVGTIPRIVDPDVLVVGQIGNGSMAAVAAAEVEDQLIVSGWNPAE